MEYINSEETLDAIWVGGPPGQSFLKIKKKLSRIGIIIYARFTVPEFGRKGKILPKTRLVFINKEITGHPAAKLARDFADHVGIPWIIGGNDAFTTLRNLQLKGILKKNVDLSTASAKTSKASKVKPTTTKEPEMSQPIREGYNDEFTNTIRAYCGTLTTTNISEFLKSEKQRRSQRILKVLKKFTSVKMTPIWEAADLLSVGEKGWNLSTWRNENNISYDSGQKKLFAMAAHGLVERTAPYVGMDRITLDEPSLSFNFQLNEKGLDELARLKGATPPTPLLPPPEALLKPELIPTQPHRENLSKEGSRALVPMVRKPQADIREAILLLQAAIAEKDPDVLEITIRNLNSESPTIDLVRKTKETFTI